MSHFRMTDVDIFVGNNFVVDPEVYQLWVNGYTAQEAANILQKRGVLQQFGATFDMLLSDTHDHFRSYAMLERLLHNPLRLQEQMSFQIEPTTLTNMIHKYYEFDSSVMREILGKKLSSRNRNNLDDVGEKTRVPLRSCRRQFDNVKRVFKVVEEMTGSLVDNIRTNFLLSEALAQQYAAIVFVTNNRFETVKKKLLYLTFDDYVFCANKMIQNWSYSSKDCEDHEDMDQDLDREFLHELREVKDLLDSKHIDKHKILVVKNVKGKLSPACQSDVENNFKNLSKSLVNIAHNIHNSKELRDLFIDLVEKFIEPCKAAGWTKEDLQEFIKCYSDTAHSTELLARNNTLARVWDRYMDTVGSCLVQMYHT